MNNQPNNQPNTAMDGAMDTAKNTAMDTAMNAAPNTAQNTQQAKFSQQRRSRARFSQEDLEYMHSLSQAVLAKNSRKTKLMLYTIVICVIGLIIWMGLAKVDEITKGQGKVVPSGQNQIVQNLEGGIVSAILVKEGDVVKKGQIILKIDNKGFESSLEESKVKLSQLLARKIRLEAEVNNTEFNPHILDEKSLSQINQKALQTEQSLYQTNIAQLNEQISQKQSEIKALQSKINHLSTSYNLVKKQNDLTYTLYKKGSVSEVEYLQISRQLNDTLSELSSAKLALPRANAELNEIKLSFANEAKKELSSTNAEIARLSKSQIGLDDKVDRTLIKSPVNGIVSKLHIHTISGVIKPGENIAEIVPLDDRLIAEVRVKPSDVAFLREGLPAMLKVSAYDFSIYGGLSGKVQLLSADTQTNEKGESYYIVRIITDKNYLGTKQRPLNIKAGMIVTADIITGSKSILDYLLKPIFKTKQNALRER